MSFVDGYRAISWFSWVSNLAVVELYLNWANIRRGLSRPADRMLSAGPH